MHTFPNRFLHIPRYILMTDSTSSQKRTVPLARLDGMTTSFALDK